MALQGNFSYIKNTLSETETVLTTITYPDHIPEGGENYEKRGTTEEVMAPVVLSETIVFEDAYIFVKAASIGTHSVFSGNKLQLLDYIARIYASREARDLDSEDFLHEFSGTVGWDASTMFNGVEEAYNHIQLTHSEDQLQNV